MKRLFAAAAVGLLSSSLPAGPAEAGPGVFKLVKTDRLHGVAGLDFVVAPSRRSAFAFGSRDRLTWVQPLAYRWDGRTWSRSRLPKGLTGTPGQADASSARNVWMTVPGNERLFEEYSGTSSGQDCPAERVTPLPAAARGASRPSRVVRWDGRRWSVAGTFKNAYVNAVAALGPRNVWVYGLDRKGPAAWHFDGGRWRRQTTELLISKAEAVSARQIWALAQDRSQPHAADGVIARFDGRAWTRVRPGALRTEPAPTKDAVGYDAKILDLNVLDRGQVWVSAATFTGRACRPGVMAFPQLHWDGRAWTSETPSLVRGLSLENQVPDGAGGLYALGFDGAADPGNAVLFHRTARGAWSRRALSPKLGVAELARIPGTRSLWAVGHRLNGDFLDVAIWRKGRP